VIGGFFGLDVIFICKNIPNDFEGAKNFKVEYTGRWQYSWVKPDGSIWGAVFDQSQCQLSPQLFIDKSMTNGVINVEIGYYTILFTDKDGVKRSSGVGQPLDLLYSNKDHPLQAIYFAGELITMCAPSLDN